MKVAIAMAVCFCCLVGFVFFAIRRMSQITAQAKSDKNRRCELAMKRASYAVRKVEAALEQHSASSRSPD